MPLSRSTPEELRAAAARMDMLYQRTTGAETAALVKRVRATRIINAPTVALLTQPDRFAWRGILFTVPRIPVALGLSCLQLQQAFDALDDLKPGDTERLARLALDLTKMQVLIWDTVKPRGLMSRFYCWRARARRHNPFTEATLGEMAKLIGFFSDCRMRHEALTLDA